MGMFDYESVQDNTLLPGMKTIMADRADRFMIGYMPNVEYVLRGDESMKLQLLLPEMGMPGMPKKNRYPLVVFVRGAAWGEQDCISIIPQLVDIARRGYVVASVKHRAAQRAKFPAFLQDVKSAIRFLRANAEKYGIDPARVAVWGDSSGGHAALMTALTGDMEEFKTDDNRELSDSVNVAVDFYGPTDVTHINDAPRNPVFTADKSRIPEDILYGGNVIEHPEISQPGNPLNYVSKDKKQPPILMMHGDSDSMVPFNQSVLMYQKLVECGKSVDFYKVRGAEHGRYFWTKQALDIVADFLGAYM